MIEEKMSVLVFFIDVHCSRLVHLLSPFHRKVTMVAAYDEVVRSPSVEIQVMKMNGQRKK